MDVVFGDCELSTDRMELRRGGALVAIEPQVFEVLAHLVEDGGRVHHGQVGDRHAAIV